MEETDQTKDQGKNTEKTVLMCEERGDKTKSRIIKDNEWERKKYIDQCKRETVKSIIKIRLHMWDLKKNYGTVEEQPPCPLCEKEDSKTEHVLQCERDEDRKQRNMKDNNDEEWEEVVQIFKENRRKREKRREKVFEERSSLDKRKKNRKSTKEHTANSTYRNYM